MRDFSYWRATPAARLAAWNNDHYDLRPKAYIPDSLAFQLDLRVVLIERELMRKLLDVAATEFERPAFRFPHTEQLLARIRTVLAT